MTRELPSEIGALLSGAGLSLLARQITDGFLVGLHRGTRQGAGTEFSQYRNYQPGDDIRRVDWKMFARSDRFFVKEAEIETSITIRFFIDASSSMLYEENGITRFDYAALTAASLATLAHRQGDAIALHVVNNQTRTDLEARRGKNQISRFYNHLENIKCSSEWPQDTGWLTECTSRRRELWVICSDMLDGAEMWSSFKEMGEAFGHELQFLQILGEHELNFMPAGVATLQDPETGMERTVRTHSVREQYLENLKKYLDQLKTAVTGRRSRVNLLQMNHPVSESLKILLDRRNRL